MDLEESAEAIQAVWTGKDVRNHKNKLKHTNMFNQSILQAGDSDCSIRQVYKWPEYCVDW